jgi:hypothetical protein
LVLPCITNILSNYVEVHDINVEYLLKYYFLLLSYKQVETFHDSRRLHVLKLSGNNISVIDNCALCNTTLQELDLSSNAMTDINEDMFNWVRNGYF